MQTHLQTGSKPAKILVVDDEAPLRFPVCECLSDVGFIVVEAGNADDALALVQADPDIELVFTDVRMPGSMNGIALARRLRAEFPLVQVIVTSGNTSVEELDPGTLFIGKPYELTYVVDRLLRTLEDFRGSSARQ